MGYASQAGRARTSSTNPQAHAICDRCGFRYNWVNLKWQYDWRGASLQNLKFLQVLDLSYNKIAAISGLDGLRLQELNLEGNELSSLEGLGGLPSLSVLNVARNKLESLQPLQSCQSLLTLDAGHNAVSVLRQVEFLRPLPWLANLTLMGNPGARKAHYRLRVLFKLPNLKRLDTSNASAEEQVRACGCSFLTMSMLLDVLVYTLPANSVAALCCARAVK